MLEEMRLPEEMRLSQKEEETIAREVFEDDLYEDLEYI